MGKVTGVGETDEVSKACDLNEVDVHGTREGARPYLIPSGRVLGADSQRAVWVYSTGPVLQQSQLTYKLANVSPAIAMKRLTCSVYYMHKYRPGYKTKIMRKIEKKYIIMAIPLMDITTTSTTTTTTTTTV